jgi:sortase B
MNPPEPDARIRADIPTLSVDFETLKNVNADSAAWIYCPDTVIDYPVMRADDYDRYLHRLPDGAYNANGSLFLDYNCPSDFSGRLSIIYGHNMKSGKMFGALTKYKEQDYFDQHPYMYLYTERENYQIDLVYGCVISAGNWREWAFMYEVNLEDLLACAALKTTFESPAAYTDKDRFLVLSTCSYEFDDARYIVIGVMRPNMKPNERD